jgi:sec-independent protein translocase protein TatA
MPFGIAWWEILLLLVVALMLFGAKRLPEMGRSLGSGMREFKDAITGKGGADEERPELPRPSEEERVSASRERDSVIP